MTPFEWNFPTKICYGSGRLKEVGSIAAAYGKKAMIATYAKGTPLDPIIEVVEAALKAAGLEVLNLQASSPTPGRRRSTRRPSLKSWPTM